jgi:hypothetical protein
VPYPIEQPPDVLPRAEGALAAPAAHAGRTSSAMRSGPFGASRTTKCSSQAELAWEIFNNLGIYDGTTGALPESSWSHEGIRKLIWIRKAVEGRI